MAIGFTFQGECHGLELIHWEPWRPSLYHCSLSPTCYHISSVFTQIIINFCVCSYSCQGMAFQLTTEYGKETDFCISGWVVSTDKQQGAHEVCVCMCVHLDEWVSGCRKERKEGGNSVEKTICSLSPILTLSPLPPAFAYFPGYHCLNVDFQY